MKNSLFITILCCNYTNLAEREDLEGILGKLVIKRYPCSGQRRAGLRCPAFQQRRSGASCRTRWRSCCPPS